MEKNCSLFFRMQSEMENTCRKYFRNRKLLVVATTAQTRERPLGPEPHGRYLGHLSAASDAMLCDAGFFAIRRYGLKPASSCLSQDGNLSVLLT